MGDNDEDGNMMGDGATEYDDDKDSDGSQRRR